MLRDREVAHDCRGADHRQLHPHFYSCTWKGVPVYWRGERQRSSATGLNLSRVSAPCRASISTWL